MKAVGVTEYGGPEVLTLVEVPRPDPGAGQIRIRVHAATVNPGDTLLRTGDLDETLRSGPLTPPYIPGMEAAGVVDLIGPDTETDLAEGDRVMTIVMPIDATGGAYAEYLVVDADQVTRAPAHTTHAEAATLPMNGLTARLALDVLHLGEGETIAVTGAAGAVGGYALQLAKVDGLRVIADAAPKDEDLVAELGADQIVARGDGVGQRIRQWWPEGVAAVVDGSLQGSDVVPAIRDGGQLAAVRGWDLQGNGDMGQDRGVAVRDVFVPEYTHAHDKLDTLRQLAEQGELTLRVARTYPAAQAAQAHRDLEAGGVRGRLVLTFD
ncbi:NADP-dependent oxidoreductase [Mycolicibacterium confluentis]|uniref:Zinc-binding alcohol dehydrogenase n=1 Tax=Mycolicibacterium confluentis TaxID=28047 RepID=A0A7I7XWE1_9MYCO|nr:NADP-dependent oxidoreductase [Mycolicibacterium confluentis]MCV7321787.1 NADP-dependent oxidoreductase [Mycolicibacterium confluentis]ORV32299.1 alcohol dehydrogenase [Mycolicibacterium confluentis]BBZ33598.1 zinc-binding alcohol dehydrogenase [Mycolicibacterium confluentis]